MLIFSNQHPPSPKRLSLPVVFFSVQVNFIFGWVIVQPLPLISYHNLTSFFRGRESSSRICLEQVFLPNSGSDLVDRSNSFIFHIFNVY